MSMEADPVIEVVDSTARRRSRRETPPLTRLYLTSLPAYVPKQRYDRLQFPLEANGDDDSNKEPVEERMAKIRTCYCMTVSVIWSILFYAISISAIPAFIFVCVAVYNYYFQAAKTMSMTNSTNTSDMAMNLFP